ncbi:MAG: preprotein translocase subunit YajC [Bryobacteraceae bacterium]|jgi:preprotein translocase subunit YajC|nr:preprotein translocase subunit YajC [Bryobacteraceae bacterium]
MPAAQSNPILGFLPVLLIFAIFYFLLFLPMQRQKKQTKAMLDGLKNGDDVVTSGGMIGTIFAINAEEDTLVLRLKPDGLKVLVARSAVTGLVGQKAG